MPATGGVIRAATITAGNRFHEHWNNTLSRSVTSTDDEGEASASATATDRGTIQDATSSSVNNRFHDHWISSSLSTSGTEDEGEAGASSSATATHRDAIRPVITAGELMIQDQYERDSRWQYISAFESRARHSHWNNGFRESTMPGGGDTDDESSLGSDNEEMAASNYTRDEGDHDQIMVDSIAKPRFLGIGKFFRGSRRASSVVRAHDGTILIASGG